MNFVPLRAEQSMNFVKRALARPPREHVYFSVAFLSVAFLISWTSALHKSTASCDSDDLAPSDDDDAVERSEEEEEEEEEDEGNRACTAWPITYIMARSIGAMIGVLLLITLALCVVEEIFRALKHEHGGGEHFTLPRIVWAWTREGLIRSSILTSILASAVFAFVYLWFLEFRGASGSAVAQGIRDVYTFQLVAFFAACAFSLFQIRVQ